MIDQKNEDNILTRITRLCEAVRESVIFLSSSIAPKNNCTSKEDKDQIISKIEEWISKSVKVIETATEKFREDEKLQQPQPFQWAGSVSLFPITNEPGSILVQMILWSCFSQSCYNAITKSLNDAREGNNVLPQKTNSASRWKLWTWLQSYAFCIKTSVHYSCKHIVRTFNENRGEWTLLKNHVSNYILLETCFANGIMSRSAEVFTMIGTNAEPSDYFTSSKSSARPHDTSSRMQLQDVAAEATKNFLRYLKRRPKVGFVNPPEGKIDVGDLTNPPHLFGDILTFMQENEKMMNYCKMGKGTKGQPPPKLGITKENSSGKNKEHILIKAETAIILPQLQRVKDKQDGKTKVPRKPLAKNALDQITPQLEMLWKSLKINFKTTPELIQAATDKIVKKHLKKKDKKLLGSWAGSKIAVLSTCVSTLLGTKSTNLSFGEKILTKVFSDALNACNGGDENSSPPLGDLLQHLSDTLFNDCAFVPGIIVQNYIVPTNDVMFWNLHFKDECQKLTYSRGKDVSITITPKEQLGKGELSIQEKKKKEKGQLPANEGIKKKNIKRVNENTRLIPNDQKRLRKSRKTRG
jgi:hypothetical protein